MGFTKKTWKNRIAEYINRRLITMEDGSTSLVTVARDEGTISQEGDAFNAANMNDLEDRIEAGFADVSQSLTWKQVKTEGKYFDFSNINYKEIHIIAYYNNYRVSCSFTQDDNGNYYFGSNEHGWVGAVIIKDNTNKDISLQNFLLSGSDVTIDANIAVYYR